MKKRSRESAGADDPAGEDRTPVRTNLQPDAIRLEDFLKPDTPQEVADLIGRLQQVVVRQSHFSYAGPLPPASEFKKYEEALPGAADRILSMSEKEQEERISARQERFRTDRFRICAATIISIGMISLAGVGFYLDYPWQAVPIGFFGVGSLILRELIKVFRSRQ